MTCGEPGRDWTWSDLLIDAMAFIMAVFSFLVVAGFVTAWVRLPVSLDWRHFLTGFIYSGMFLISLYWLVSTERRYLL